MMMMRRRRRRAPEDQEVEHEAAEAGEDGVELEPWLRLSGSLVTTTRVPLAHLRRLAGEGAPGALGPEAQPLGRQPVRLRLLGRTVLGRPVLPAEARREAEAAVRREAEAAPRCTQAQLEVPRS